MGYFGIDASLTCTGWAYLNGSMPMELGSVGMDLSKATEREKVERIIYIANELVGLVKVRWAAGVKPQVGIEGYAFGKIFGKEALAELQGVIKTQMFMAHGIVVQPIPSTRARKLAGLEMAARTIRSKVDGKWVKRPNPIFRPSKEQVQTQLAAKGFRFEKPEFDRMDAFVVALALRSLHENPPAARKQRELRLSSLEE